MPAAVELAIANACNSVADKLSPSFHQSVCCSSSKHSNCTWFYHRAQPSVVHKLYCPWTIWGLQLGTSYVLQLIRLFCYCCSCCHCLLCVAAFTVLHISPNSFGQSTYINWSLVAITNKGDAESIRFSHLWIFSPSRVIAWFGRGEPNNKKRNCPGSSTPYATKFWTNHKHYKKRTLVFFFWNICQKSPLLFFLCSYSIA